MVYFSWGYSIQLNGKGTKKDLDEAFFNFYIYGDSGYSYYMMATMLDEGGPDGSKKDLHNALKYYNKAIDNGYKKAEPALIKLMESM